MAQNNQKKWRPRRAGTDRPNRPGIHKGQLCEQKAMAFFQKKGWKIIAKNQRLEGVEIDLILEKPNAYLLVEVKSNNSWRREYPINIKQKKRLLQAFSAFCEQHNKPVYIQLAIVGQKNDVCIFELEF